MSVSNSIYISVTFALFYLFAANRAAHHGEIPEYLHICHKSDPDLIGCMKKSIEIIRPFLVTGIPEVDIPSIEPMRIGDLLVSESSANNGLHISAKDIDSYGASNFLLRNLEVVDYGKHYTVEVFFPKLHVEGTYDVNGQVLLLPIRGHGKFVGNFSECTGSLKLLFDKKEDFAHIKKFQVKIKVGHGKIHLYNLFNGDKALGNAINDVINQNFDVISRDIIPLVEKALSKTLRRISTKIIQNFNYDMIFPL